MISMITGGVILLLFFEFCLFVVIDGMHKHVYGNTPNNQLLKDMIAIHVFILAMIIFIAIPISGVYLIKLGMV